MRAHLAARDLDWDLPAYPPLTPDQRAPAPLEVEVVAEEPAKLPQPEPAR